MTKTKARRFKKIKLFLALAVGFGVSLAVLKVVNLRLDFAPEVQVAVARPDFSKLQLAQGSFAVLVNGHMICEQAGGELRPTASTTKMILALAVMEKRPFGVGENGGTLVLGRDDYEFYRYHLNNGGSRTQVEVGEVITERQALEALLIKSSNNMADSLAVWAFGSMEEYRNYAHKMLLGWGLQDTTIGDDASGLSPTTTSTAHDLAVVGQKVLAEPVLAQIIQQPEVEIPVVGKITNSNYLIARNSDIVGIKSGFTDEAGRNFVLGAKDENDTIVVSVLGIDKKGNATDAAYELYSQAMELAEDVVVVRAGEKIGALHPKWLDGEIELYADEMVAVDVWRDETVAFELELEDEIVGKVGRIGRLKVVINHDIKYIPVSVKTEITKPDWLFRIFN
jgi:D-alanyl-D-alanine carboxypeptidase